MPFVLFLLGAAAVALVASQAKATPKGGGRTYTLDANLPPQLRQQVLAALATEKEPQRLYVFAAQLAQTGYPLAALALTQRAAQLGGTPPWPVPGPQPSPAPSPAPSPSPGPAPIVNPVDPGQLPEPPRSQVLAALATGTDPGALLQLAAQMDAQGYSYAAAALRMKATVLQNVPQPSPAPSPSPMPPPGVLPGPAPSPAPQPSPGPAPNPFALDPGMPPQMQSAVLGALTTETDPVKLAAFAQSIQSQYPIAAGLLMTKALALRGGPAPSPQPTTAATAVVTTHDPPPAGDLRVFDKPNGSQIGGIDKNATVKVLQWNADGANTWARVASTGGGRNAATTGYVHQAYLQPAALVSAAAPKSVALAKKGGTNGLASHA